MHGIPFTISILLRVSPIVWVRHVLHALSLWKEELRGLSINMIYQGLVVSILDDISTAAARS